MAGGGTGGVGQVKPNAPTANDNVTTWGKGAGKPGTPVNIKFTPVGNPFGPGGVSWNKDLGGYQWNKQLEVPIAIALIGDVTGRYLPNTLQSIGAAPGSPISLDEAMSTIIAKAQAKPGGIAELKKKFNEKEYYVDPKKGQDSIALADATDPYFYAALETALTYATMYNADVAAKQGNTTNPKILSFDDFLLQAPKSGAYSSSSFGGGGGGRKTTITHQKFKPEDFDIAIDQLFQQTVGRGATEEELADFVGKLQVYDTKNPQKTVSVTSGDTTKTTQSGGVSADIMQSMMREQALANPEAESYNKATKYLSYFMEALDNPIELG